MKNKITLYALLLLSSFSTIQAGSRSINVLSVVTPITFQDNTWKKVYNANNLTIYLKVETLSEGRFISYKYENSSSKEISFSLELIKNNKIVSNNKMTITLKENTSEIFFDPTDTVQLGENESIDDYTVKIN
ncbi:MAG: hypothetical protein P1U41_10750 [Vicingaceae bacterium]|nr:hypothetical protein [Vicingaceae bacterium]